MKILFCATHVGLLRHYGSVLQLLVDRGHSVHVACEEVGRGLGANADPQRVMGVVSGVTFGDVPTREKTAWTAWSYWLHLLMDWVRYFDPRFAAAEALRVRVEYQVPRRAAAVVHAVRRIDPTCRHVLRMLRALDRVTPPSRVIQSFVAEAKPDLVMVSPYVYVGFEQADHVKAAQALGVRTAVCIASWDNLTNKGLISTVPDRVFVWNDAQRDEAVSLHGVPPDRAVVTGAQLFDRWFDRQPSRSREEFCAIVGLDPGRPYIMYTGSSDFIAPREGAFVRQWVQTVRGASDPVVAGAGILIRPHPKNHSQFVALGLEDVDNVAVWPLGAKTFDPTFDEDFFDSLYHSRVVVGINTSAQIEAAIVGRPVRTWRAPDFVHSQNGTLHFQYLAADDGGLVRVAESAQEHLAHLTEVLSGSTCVDERTRRFVESFVRPHGLAVPATQVFADAVERMIAVQPVPSALPVWGRPVRMFLYGFGAVLAGQRARRRDAPPRPRWALPIRVVVALSVYTAWLFYKVGDRRDAFRASLRQARKANRAAKQSQRGRASVASAATLPVPTPDARLTFRLLPAPDLRAVSFRRAGRTLGHAMPELGKGVRRASRQVARATRTAARRTIRAGRRGVVETRAAAWSSARRVIRLGRRGVMHSRSLVWKQGRRAYRIARRGALHSRYAAGTLARRALRAGHRGVMESRDVVRTVARRARRVARRGAMNSRVIAGAVLRKAGWRRSVRKEPQPPVETV